MQKIVNLDQAVIDALEFLSTEKLPRLKLADFSFPLVVGSGNAYNTAQIIFSKQKAVIADESSFKDIFLRYKDLINKKIIKEAIIISASGEKDSVWEVELAKKNKLKTFLLTCSPASTAAKLADKVFVYPKTAEPYTYNVSTYLGMILSLTGENPATILETIKKIKLKKKISDFKSFSFILPDDFLNICPMLDIKKSELFGPLVSVRSFSFGQARHAKFVIRDKRELVLTIGTEKNKHFGLPSNREQILLSLKKNDFALIFCLTYYLVGKIQEAKPAYFKKHIKNYCQDYGPKAYGQNKKFDLIVK